jgi:hypothetical protein
MFYCARRDLASRIFVLMRRRTSIRETARRPIGKRTRLFPLIVAQIAALVVGVSSLACCAQQNRLANTLPYTPVPPPTLNLAASKDLPVRTDLLPVAENVPDLPRTTEEPLPDAPTPNIEPAAANPDGSPDPNHANPSDTNDDPDEVVGNLYASASADSGTPQQNQRQTTPGFPPISPTQRRLPPSRGEHPSIPSQTSPCQTDVCTSTPANMCCTRNVNYFERFVDAGIHPLSARQKGYLALRNTVDPYNFATIGFFSAISVASDSHSAYGPGFPGFARNFGVAYCETAVDAFFGTFLIPAIAHQDPHYHRMPNASYARRALHAVTAVVWAQSDYGLGMPNYSGLITTVVGDGLGNLYVPGRQKSWGSAAARDLTNIATAPIGNFITEFVPDVARRVNVKIVLIQQIVNQVEKSP